MVYMSTGQAAKLLSVTPDTVLKWVKKGKLRARRTAGGHYRVFRESAQALLTQEENLPVQGSPPFKKPAIYCWEHNAVSGKVNENCRSCLVYKAKGAKCYEVGRFLKESGYGATCCPTSCEECSYYKQQLQRPVNVLVFTADEAFERLLSTGSKFSRYKLQFTSSLYDCSLIVDSFRPECAILDCSKEPKTCEKLSGHLTNDPRIPGVKVILVLPPGKSSDDYSRKDVSVIVQPFSFKELEGYMQESAPSPSA